MQSHHLLLMIHLVGATIWVGGHLVLATTILPQVLKKKSPQMLLDFEQKYEKIGMPALIVMVITGVWMALKFGVKVSDWFNFETPLETAISLKLLLLFSTVAFAISAKTWVIPNLSPKTLPIMAVHIIGVTTIGVCFLIVGSFFRYGGISF